MTGALLGVAIMTAGRELTRRLGQDGFEIFGIGLDEAPLDWIFRENLQTVFLGLSMLGFMIWRPTGILDDWELDGAVYRKFFGGESEKPEALPELEDVPAAQLSASGIDVRFGGFHAPVSYTHLRAPRDATLSRMPSSA